MRWSRPPACIPFYLSVKNEQMLMLARPVIASLMQSTHHVRRLGHRLVRLAFVPS